MCHWPRSGCHRKFSLTWALCIKDKKTLIPRRESRIGRIESGKGNTRKQGGGGQGWINQNRGWDHETKPNHHQKSWALNWKNLPPGSWCRCLGWWTVLEEGATPELLLLVKVFHHCSSNPKAPITQFPFRFNLPKTFVVAPGCFRMWSQVSPACYSK